MSSSALSKMKANNLGIYNYGTMPDGSQCWGKNGYFPGSMNGGAELSSSLVHCDNGVTGVLMLNGTLFGDGLYLSAANEAFIPQQTRTHH